MTLTSTPRHDLSNDRVDGPDEPAVGNDATWLYLARSRDGGAPGREWRGHSASFRHAASLGQTNDKCSNESLHQAIIRPRMTEAVIA